MSDANPDPHDGRRAQHERTVPPGETPPAESSTGPETGPRGDVTRGWAKGPLIAIGVVVVLCAAFFLVYAIIVAR